MKNILLYTFIMAAFGLQAQIDRSVRPQASKAPAVNIPDSEIFDLDNGMTVILSKNDKIPRVSFNLVMGTDPMLEGEKSGLADFAGSMILSGTKNLSKDELDFKIDYMGANISASSSSIYVSGLSKYDLDLIAILAEIVKNANFPESEFDRIKKQSASALTMTKSDANTMASNITNSVVFGKKHPRGESMTEETLEAITLADVKNYFHSKFTPRNSYLVVVGDIDAARLQELIKNTLGDWTGKVTESGKYVVKPNQKGSRVIFGKKAGAVQSVIQVAIPLNITPGHPDEIKVKLMNQILGGGTFEARLMQNLREDKAYTYGCYSGVSIARTGSYFYTSGSFRNEVTDSAVTQILSEIRTITENPVTEEELQLAKASMSGSFVRALERPQTIADFALSIFRNKLDKDYYKNYLKMIEETTISDINKMAESYLDYENAYIVVVGNEKIAENLLPFDQNGKIEYYDAFGNPETGFKKADISAEKVIENYILAVTQSKTRKEAEQKIGKIKSMTQVMTATPSGAPVSFDMYTYLKTPSSEAMEVLFNGQVMQRTFFNGKAGGMESSPMAGGQSIEYSDEEVAEKKKTIGLIPEVNYSKHEVEFKLLGIKKEMGKDYYVIETSTSNSVTQDYYSVSTFQKERSSSVTTMEGETSSSSVEYRKFNEVNGILFPHELSQMAGSMSLLVEVKSIEINKSIDDKKFVK
ncbi:pitrilysin family protein [Wandonia haliotis]|uniref:Pitrilysin family protein n=1 Tax=Wandonia haliotis TaxID=574963 RepID=A0ABN1MRE0_9FLAO